jgi:twitching motility two-component system response regulator PilH
MPAALSSPDAVACMAATKILVVDDSPTQRFFIADLLQRRGYQVVTAGDGDEALAKIRTERPALIVMDVVMPGRSGFQMTRALTRDPATQEIPVILCTTKSTDTDRIWGLRQGAREYVVKPVDAEELLAKIADLVH